MVITELCLCFPKSTPAQHSAVELICAVSFLPVSSHDSISSLGKTSPTVSIHSKQYSRRKSNSLMSDRSVINSDIVKRLVPDSTILPSASK